MERIRAVFNWSGGKDSAHALWRAMRSGDYEIVALLTTVDGSTRRSTMHGIPAALLQAQAERIGIPLYRLDLAPNGDMADYGAAMSRAVAHFGARGVTHFIFGDIFLHDVRAYRERQLAPFGIEVVEPLWGESSQEVMADFLASGLKTVVVTTMDDGLGRAAVGRVVDRDFVASLPAGTDPNGENGEYHTFCYDGPIFASPVPFRLGTPFSRSYGSTTGRRRATPIGSPICGRRDPAFRGRTKHGIVYFRIFFRDRFRPMCFSVGTESGCRNSPVACCRP